MRADEGMKGSVEEITAGLWEFGSKQATLIEVGD